jgi:hypothetical protein
MKLRWKLGAIASVLALATSFGVALAGPAAAAANGNMMCAGSSSNRCAHANSGEAPPPVFSEAVSSTWNSPRSGEGEITLHAISPAQCMELHNDDLIVWTECTSKVIASQEWFVNVGTRDGSPVYFYQSAYDTSLCLNAPPIGSQLDATSCGDFTNQNQAWFLG